MGQLLPLKHSRIRRGVLLSVLGLGCGLSLLPHTALAQSRGSTPEFERANRVAEALRQVTLLGNSRNPGYYSDWQVKGDRIPLWSRQCLGQSLTPEAFEANKSAATSTVTCIVQDMLRQEIRSAKNDEGLAIRRIAAWWVTGDPSRYDEANIAAYTKRVLTTYQPNGPITAAVPAPAKPISVAPIATAVNPNPTNTLPPIANGSGLPGTISPGGQLRVPTEILPPVKPRQAVVTPAPVQPTPVVTPTPIATPTPVVTPSPAPSASSNTPTPIKANGTNFYDRYMQEGYVASRAKDYAKALLFFRRALDERPEDNYAATAIKNMEALTGGR
jgi:hypothetical protein